jgi:DNA-binding IscR family transcriptional regulator
MSVWSRRSRERGAYTSVSEIAEAEGIDKGYVSRVLRLALLAPDIIESILGGGRIRRCCWSTRAAATG